MEALIFFLKFWLFLSLVCGAVLAVCFFMWPHHLVWPGDDQEDRK